MRYTYRLLPMCLVTLVTLTACVDDSTIVAVDALEPGGEEVGPETRQSMEVEGYPTPGELRNGFIYDRAGQPLEVTYEIHDGLAIWQGDIVIGRPDRIATSLAELTMSVHAPPQGVVIDDNSKRWPGGVVPYVISDAPFPSRVTSAIQIIEDQTPGVTLVPRAGEADYINFRLGSGCSSSIGMVGGEQFINLASGCSTGNAAHEILHALGMYHEHTRCNRDNFVTIDYDEIQAGKEGNFFKAGSGTEDGACSGAFDIGAYDEGSMMHYGQFAFAIGSNPTIIPKDGVDGSAMGQRSQVGPTDQETIDQLYGANNAAPVAIIAAVASFPEGTPVPLDASGSTDADDDNSILTYEWTFGDGTCTVVTPPAACSDDDPDHTYADNDAYDVEVTVSDGFDDDADQTVVTITNVSPSVDVGDDPSVDEGSEFAQSGSFTDPGADTWTATVNYGDGGGAQALALDGKGFDLAHTYVDNGVNTVTVVVTDDDGGVGNDDAEVTVNNVAPTVEAGPDATIESGEIYNFSGAFSDPGIEDDPWGWVIAWGFGPNTEGSTDDQSAAIEASRQVCVAGDYTVHLTVTDKDGGVGMDELSLTVPYIGIDIDIMPGTDLNPVNLKKKGRLPVAILGSADLDVADIDPSSLTLGDETDLDTPIGQKKNGTYEAYLEDVNEDGFMDLVTMFPVTELVGDGDLTELSSELVLRGFLADACTNIRGVDAVLPLSE